MSDPTDKWQELLNQMASGEPVDWDTQDISNGAEGEILAHLKSIDQIQRVFAANITEPANKSQRNEVVMFEWGHLHVIEQLGEGGYGEVYRAFDPVLNRDVALKLLKPDQLAAFHSKLFIEEAQRIAQVRNRHVLAIHGAGVNDGRVGFWSDLIVGETLVQEIHVDQNKLLLVATAMAQALQAVHESGLVHGDVKAANVMLDQNQQYVLMDFGAGLESGAQHPSNHSVGSPMLMAPELFTEAAKSPASDIYALGCLLFKMASGRYPVQGENVLDIAQAHKDGNYSKLQTHRPDMPASLMRLIQAMIHSDAISRPSAKEVVRSLEMIKGEPRRRRKRRMVMGIMGSLAVGLVLASAGLFFANKERQKAVEEQQKAQAVNEFLQEILGSAFNVGKGREVRVADMLDLAAKNAKSRFASQPLTLAAISESIGKSYHNLRLIEQSNLQFQQSHELLSASHGQNHPETLQLRLRLARTEKMLGRFQNSQKLLKSVIDSTLNKPELRALHLNALIVSADAYSKSGDFDLAEQILMSVESALVYQPESSNVYFLAQLGLSSNYLAKTQFFDAERAAMNAIASLQEIQDPKPTNQLAANSHLALALNHQGKLVEAETILTESLELAEQYFGKNNNGYLIHLTNLGANLQRQGKLKQALSYQETSVSLASELKGEYSLVTINNKNNLANTYVSLKRIEQGEQLMRDTLEDARTFLGKQHLDTLKMEYNLAELLNNTQRYSAAEALVRSSLPVMQASLGDQHLVTLLSRDNLAVSLVGQQKYAAALAIHPELLTEMIAVFGASSPFTFLVWGHAIDTLQTAGELPAAINQQQLMLNEQVRVYGEEHPDAVASAIRLTELKRGQQ